MAKKKQQVTPVRSEGSKEAARDLLDLAVISDRRQEPSRPFRDYLAEKKKP